MSTIGDTTFWILSALSAGPRHGYGILRDVESLSDGETVLKVPTLYTNLDRLQHAGFIEAAGEEIVDGRARRYFALTDAGRAALEAEIARLRAKARVASARLSAGRAATARTAHA